VRPEELGKLGKFKEKVISSGIEPAIFWFVA
jgi:hypothetical protein